MFDIIKESFKLTNKYIVLATPLILFSLLSSLYLVFSSGGRAFGLVIAVFLFFLMLCAFLSGWFFMLKKIMQEDAPEKPDALISEFPAGVGEYFLSVIGMVFNIIIIFMAIGLCSYLFGMKFIGHPGISGADFSAAMTSQESIKSFLTSLNDDQLAKISEWNILLFLNMIISYFLMMFYSPALVFKNKNPFIALFLSLKDLCSRKIFKNIVIFLVMFTSYFILSVLSGLFGKNIFVHFLFTLINFYYITYIAVLLFNYYYKNYAKAGSYIDTTV